MTTAFPTPAEAPAAADAESVHPDVELIERAVALKDLISEAAEEGARIGHVPDHVIAALREAGLLRLTVPRRYGGYEANSRTFSDVLTELARADGSTAWSVMLLNIGNWFASTLAKQGQDDLWGDNPDATSCVVLAPQGKATRTEGGYRVSGRWGYASGSFAATHGFHGVLVEQPDGSLRHGLALLCPGQWSVERSWFPIGMRATGSDTVVAEDAFVPEHRIQYFEDLVEGRYATEFKESEPRSRAAFLPTGTVIFGAVLVGLAKAAFEQSVERIKTKGVAGTRYTQSKESPSHQLSVARAAGLVDVAELLVRRSAYDIDSNALAGEGYMDELTRARVRHDTGMVVDLVTEAVDLLLKAAGSSSFMENNALSRIYCDLGTGGSHVHATPGIATDNYGKLLLGSSTPIPAHV
ncbi:acyl-CoA dehydrogenase family protein [Streptomyces sp. NPDC046909]|uniref:acyl-CoA dehydrogenase family protein n=1 Tax=Streptomyces sp. NPDC046909 TaxID=3155617 RepID=UPI0033EE2753